MALTTCSECKKEISTTVAACPHCGFKHPTNTGIGAGGWTVIIACAWLAYMIFSPSSPPAPPPPQKTAAQLEAERKKEEAFQRVVLSMKTLRGSLRNPSSLAWDSIRANDDASVVCLQYRAQNGFGGMNKEFVVWVKGIPSQLPDSWKKQCLQPLNDFNYAVHAM